MFCRDRFCPTGSVGNCKLRIANCKLQIGNPQSQFRNPHSAIRNRRGFSLVEIMVVVVIMGLLAGGVAIGVRGYLTRAKQATVRTEIATIVKAIDTFYGEYSRYPSPDEGLEILSKPSDRFGDPLLSGEAVDPWGRPYQYNVPGTDGHRYEVICYGQDGREGGEGVDADITSTNLKKR